MGVTIRHDIFEWDEDKNQRNVEKHEMSFVEATAVFSDADRVFKRDRKHSTDEERWFCLGLVGERVALVRFTLRGQTVRIIGAGYWKKGEKLYEDEKKTKTEGENPLWG